MNSTSFTSIDTACTGSGDKMANIDSSSTAQLTLNAMNRPLHSARGRNQSDSDIENSPIITVITHGNDNTNANNTNTNNNSATNDNNDSTITIGGTSNSHRGHNNHNLHGRFNDSLSRRPHFITMGFSLSNRLHLSKQRTLWSRASSLEKLLMVAVALLAALTVLLFVTLITLFVSHGHELEELSTASDPSIRHLGDLDHRNLSSDVVERRYCMTPDCVKIAASVIEAIDTSVDPCDDFYMYSCGDWIKSNPLPDGKSNWGTFSKLWQDNQSIMRSVLESATFDPGSAEEKAKIYYDSCLDKNDTVEQKGTKPMQDLIESAGGWNISGHFDINSWNLQSALQIYHNQYNRGGLFSWAVGADERNSTRNVIQLDQGGLSLPSRDYYLNKTDKNVLDAYFMYMLRVVELMGGSEVEQQAKDVLEFEKKLASITIPQDQRRDDERMYNKFTLRELHTRAPFLNWTKYFDDAFDYHSRTTINFSSEIKPRKNMSDIFERLKEQTQYSVAMNLSASSSLTDQGAPSTGAIAPESNYPSQNQLSSTIGRHKITEDESIVVYSPEYFAELSKLVAQYEKTSRGKATLANYMGWSVIQSLIHTLPNNFKDASKTLRKALIGSEGIEVTWRHCVTDTNQVMGFALGSLFVRRVFQGNSKERAEEMIYSIRNAFKDNLANLAWMDDRTRMLAREKADNINQMIGFPDFILSPEKLNGKYEGLELDVNNFFENSIKVNILSLRENMEKINLPANKTEWDMTPPMVNAYYTPTKNQIVFPAGILQTPFYDLSYPNSLNYGAMGVVMGHELTHAFDDQGREYDKDGNLYQWWYNETLKKFEDRVKCFVDQYSSYKIDDHQLNGKQTLGENIADNGGLKAAFRAYEKWAAAHPEPMLPGLNLTSKQLFFVGFAQVWCSISTSEALKLQVLNDPHAPAQFRVIGTLSNSQEFAREFNCPSGANMNPENKCVVW